MTAEARSEIEGNFYEVLPEIVEEGGYAKLTAGFTANNGIRIHIAMIEGAEAFEGGEFDFSPEQAELVGQALVRWAQRSRAEGELFRCGYLVRKP